MNTLDPTTEQAAALLDTLMRDPAPLFAREADAAMIQRLEQDGCVFGGNSATGLTLTTVGLGCYGDYLRWATHHAPVAVYRATASTQDACRSLLTDTSESSLSPLVVTDYQSAGRGRLGRTWVAPPKACALFSLAVPLNDNSPERLALAAAVAVSQTIDNALRGTGHRPVIKWPNDTLVEGRKIAGVLIETHQFASVPIAIVGIGINVNLNIATLRVSARTNPQEQVAPDRITSLHQLGCATHRLAVIANTVNALKRAISEPDHVLLNQWRAQSLITDTEQTFVHNGQTITGRVIDIDPNEGLVVRTQQGAVVYLPAATTTTKQ